MTAATLTLTDFLLARIAEDELWAYAMPREGYMKTIPSYLSRRALAECESKRRIVERLKWAPEHPDWENDAEIGGHWSDAHETLCDLTAPYVDHPDCREEWRP